jgi:two-component system, OmpR family, alkaline phosphatase synthesis response regulator PhoP
MTQSVLVVDDEPNIVLSLEFLMKQMDLDVRVAEDGDAALQEIGRQAPDLVLLDVMMPKRDGFSVCRAIRANAAWDDVKIIMLTAKSRDEERERGLAAGADDYIVKPFSTRDVRNRVGQILKLG